VPAVPSSSSSSARPPRKCQGKSYKFCNLHLAAHFIFPPHPPKTKKNMAKKSALRKKSRRVK